MVRDVSEVVRGSRGRAGRLLHDPDSGQIEIDGQPVELNNPADAKAAGMAVIYQEPRFFPDPSVAENIAMGRQPLARFGAIDRAAVNREAARLFTGSGSPSSRRVQRVACPSPTSRLWRSPRPSRPRPASS